nr:hypothetical protein [Tanacetum cinerariifolium]
MKHLLNSVQNGPFQVGTSDIPATTTTHASTRVRTMDDLTKAEMIREAFAKEIWDRVKLLIEGLEISLFVTYVKLTKDMHNSSFDQLYAYLRQHEVHDNEVIMMRQRFPDPLALTRDYAGSGAKANATGTVANRNMGTKIVNQSKTDDLDAFDSDYDEAPSASAVLMAKLSAYDSDVLFEENKTVNESLTVELERYKEMVRFFKERRKFDLNDREKYIDPQMRRAFEKDVIPFVKSLRESFVDFELGLYREVYEMKAIFQQMETKVEQCSVDRKYFEMEKKILLIENDHILEKITAMHSYDDFVKYVDMEKSYIDEYSRCLKLEAELSKKKDMVEKAVYNKLLNRFSRLEK